MASLYFVSLTKRKWKTNGVQLRLVPETQEAHRMNKTETYTYILRASYIEFVTWSLLSDLGNNRNLHRVDYSRSWCVVCTVRYMFHRGTEVTHSRKVP